MTHNDDQSKRDERRRTLEESNQQLAEMQRAELAMQAEQLADNDPLPLNPAKVRQVIADTWSRLSPEDQAQRNLWDIAHGVPGATMHVHGDEVEIRRGGRTLLVIPFAELTGDEPLPPGEFVPDVPDMVPDDLDDRDV